ncbi:MAG: DUF2147 domain-containing protein, partial [Pseudobacter sp.]|uniref:DUF2147 domain-containing protein n=1 Tax=Pseudobacter sp. TaxID=2045420 RepID=UPI003F814763
KQIVLLTLTLVFSAAARSQQADQVLGQWLSEDKDGKIEIYKTGDKYFGKLIWASKMYEADGKTSRKDEKNNDASLRSRNLKDLVLLSNFIYDDGVYTDGKIYDPKSGKTYSCKMTLSGEKLNIRGYMGLSILGRTTVWSRVK